MEEAVAEAGGVLAADAVGDPEPVSAEEAVADAVAEGMGDGDLVRDFVHSLLVTKYESSDGTADKRL